MGTHSPPPPGARTNADYLDTFVEDKDMFYLKDSVYLLSFMGFPPRASWCVSCCWGCVFFFIVCGMNGGCACVSFIVCGMNGVCACVSFIVYGMNGVCACVSFIVCGMKMDGVGWTEETARRLVELGFRGKDILSRVEWRKRKEEVELSKMEAAVKNAPRRLAHQGKDLSASPFLEALAQREELVLQGKLTVSGRQRRVCSCHQRDLCWQMTKELVL